MTNRRFNEIIKEAVDYVVNSTAAKYSEPVTSYNYSNNLDNDEGEEELNEYNSKIFHFVDGTVKRCLTNGLRGFTLGHDRYLAKKAAQTFFYDGYDGEYYELNDKERDEIIKRLKYQIKIFTGTMHNGAAEENKRILKFAGIL